MSTLTTLRDDPDYPLHEPDQPEHKVAKRTPLLDDIGNTIAARTGPNVATSRLVMNPGRGKAGVLGLVIAMRRRIQTTRPRKRDRMIIIGIVLLILGMLTGIPVLWPIGILLVLVGAILWALGAAGREVGGRRHYY